jgi:hypothetical protein
MTVVPLKTAEVLLGISQLAVLLGVNKREDPHGVSKVDLIMIIRKTVGRNQVV